MSAGTFSQIHLHIIFAVRGRQSQIKPEWEEKLYAYITGIVKNKEQKLLAIGGYYDHIHLLIGIRPNCRISDLVKEIKRMSNNYINENKLSKYKFDWQEGYSVFSYNKSMLPRLISYIRNQKEHHRKRSFKEEYIEFLKRFEVEYDEKFLFKWVDVD